MNQLKAIMNSLMFFSILPIITSFITDFSSSTSKRNWIPPDFNPKDVILLIQEHPFNKKQNERMIAFLTKEYHGRYEVADLGDIKGYSPYTDKSLYRFALLWTDETHDHPGSNVLHHDIDGHFLDRSTGTEYPTSRLGLSRGQIGYRKVIESINKHFKNE